MRTNFSMSGLDEVQFADAVLTDVTFSMTDLRKTIFERCTFIGVDFTISDLRGLSFDGATFTGVKFDQAGLEGVSLRGAILQTVPSAALEQEVLQGPAHRGLRRRAHGQADLRRAQGLRRRPLQRDRRIRRDASMATPPLAIQVKGLHKSYGKLEVLKGVDFDVASGSIFALLGSNGAGKTTVVKILSTLLKPDGGTASVNGFDVAAKPEQVRRVDQPDRAIRRGRRDPHRPGKPDHDRQAAAAQEPPPGRRRPARTLRPHRRRRPPGGHLLGRHAPPARHRHEPHRRPAGHLPRRADHRARPGGAHRGVEGDPEPGRQRHDGPADHPVPGGGREAGRPDRDPARGHHHRQRHPGGAAEAAPAREGRIVERQPTLEEIFLAIVGNKEAVRP